MSNVAEVRWTPTDWDSSVGYVTHVGSGRLVNSVAIPLQDACEIFAPMPVRVKIS